MKNIAIIVPQTAVIEAVADPRYLFTAVNQFLVQQGKEPAFTIQLVGLSKEISLADGVFSIRTDCTIQTASKPDLIIIPALSGDLNLALQKNQDFIPWIIQHYKSGCEVASLCLGAFLLAATGLMDGTECSTHWLFANEFRSMFPQVKLVDDKIITEKKGLYSSGGANSYWNLLLHLVEKYTSRELSILAAKFFVLDIGRDSQSPFSIFQGQKLHNDPPILRAQEFIENNYFEKITVEELCEKLGIGRRTFERRFKKATNNTVVEYMQRVKIEAAKKEFEIGRKTVSEVMFEVGYTDNKAFRDVFRKITSMSPVNYRQRYNKEIQIAS